MSHEDKDYVAHLHAHGYRATQQRLLVLDAVCAVGGHSTFGTIHAKVKDFDPTIDQSTIYRALDVLNEVGLIAVSEIGDSGKVYKVAGEADHYHLVCRVCGAVSSVDPVLFRGVFEQIRQSYGFEVGDDHLALPGLCEKCRQQT